MKVSTKSLLLLSISAAGGALIYWMIQRKRQEQERLAQGNWAHAHEGRKDSIRDEAGNYDIDGVSYDDKGVIVGSEPHHVTSPKHPRPEEMH